MIARFLNLHVFACALAFLALSCGEVDESQQTAENRPAIPAEPIERFGLIWETFEVDSGVVASGQSLSHILSPAGMSAGEITLLAQATQSDYDVRNMRSGKSWWIAYDRDSSASAAHFIYQRNAREYARFSLQEPYGVALESLPADTLIQRTKGTIENSLYVDLDRLGAPTTLALAMANVYAWTVDFSRLQKDDEFDVMYERTYVNGEPIGMPRVIACHFQHRGRALPAFRYDQGDGFDYFDEAGQSLRKAFLKAPVEFSRISSRYNLKRFHPILQKTKAHYGTDYAAPKGTPIISVGDGVVSKSSYTKGNGKYVKIRHNNTYETQYLHMSRRAVSAGEHVKQGQVIGYVGSTGLATGPHVCFRFWKNGKQVDHLREEFPPSTPIMANQMDAFQATVEKLSTAISESQHCHKVR
jgi:murein DD-endopeptidase MepM/ murein hydrolase activator NlpD